MDTSASGNGAADNIGTALPPTERALLTKFAAWVRSIPEAEDPSGSIETLQLLFEVAPTLGDLDDQNVPPYSLAQPSADLVNALIEYAEEGEDELAEPAPGSITDDDPATNRRDGRTQAGRGLGSHNRPLISDDGEQDAPTTVALTLDDYFQFLTETNSADFQDAADQPTINLDGLADAQDAATYALVKLTGLGDDLLLDTEDLPATALSNAFEEPAAHIVLRDANRIKPISALDRVLAWLGSDGRPLTGEGSVTQEDVQTLGSLLGLEDDLRGIDSIWSVPRLAAWWRTLEDSGIVTEDETTVRPGTQAKHFTADDAQERAGSRGALVANYLQDVLFTYAYEGKDGDSETTAQSLPVLLAVLTAALVHDEDDIDFDAEAVAPAGESLPSGAQKVLAQLVSDGILVARPDDSGCPYTVPEGIKHSVADVVSDATEALWEEP